MINFLNTIYFNRIVFTILGLSIALFSLGLLHYAFFSVGIVFLALLLLALVIETIVLFTQNNPIELQRKLPIKLSNGDLNKIVLRIKSKSNLNLKLSIIEELPEQLQLINWTKKTSINAGENIEFTYDIAPKSRGNFHWQNSYVLIKLFRLSLVSRKITFELDQEVACYPSFEQFKKLPINVIVNNFQESNTEKYVRKIGQSLEFEQIKDYSPEDDFRHINWKASAKSGKMMINQYQDERSQNIYSIIDLGRTMKMPFNNLTLLDYAINASLALSKTVIEMQDRAGIIGLSNDKCNFLQANKNIKQMGKINELLYNIETNFLEANYELLYKFIRVNIRHRSLLVIYTNFESVNSLHRQMPYLKALANYHLLLVVFFENSEVNNIIDVKAKNLREIYTTSIAQSLMAQNKLIAKELQKYGIQSLFIEPEKLNLAIINKFLAIKKRQII
jgi:uncharacterized protein (DUF58 family)